MLRTSRSALPLDLNRKFHRNSLACAALVHLHYDSQGESTRKLKPFPGASQVFRRSFASILLAGSKDTPPGWREWRSLGFLTPAGVLTTCTTTSWVLPSFPREAYFTGSGSRAPAFCPADPPRVRLTHHLIGKVLLHPIYPKGAAWPRSPLYQYFGTKRRSVDNLPVPARAKEVAYGASGGKRGRQPGNESDKLNLTKVPEGHGGPPLMRLTFCLPFPVAASG